MSITYTCLLQIYLVSTQNAWDPKSHGVRVQRRTADREAALVDIAVRAVEMLATASAAAAAAAGRHGGGGAALAAGGGADAAGAELGAAVSGGELPAAQVNI